MKLVNEKTDSEFLEGLWGFRAVGALLVLMVLLALAGCETEDCVNCIELPPPVVPTGVHSISGDNEVIVQWYDISYHPYDGSYNANVERYYVYSRYFEDGDQYDANREFFLIGEVYWNQNFDATSGLHWFIDDEAVNGFEYEYAVAAVNGGGLESALSYEFVIDAPLPHSLAPVLLYDVNGAAPQWASFDFSLMDDGRNPSHPGFQADITVEFTDDVAYVQAHQPRVLIQDAGVFTDENGNLIFEGVGWAPADGYSSTGLLELIPGHIYVVEIADGPQSLHYAKFAVTDIGTGIVEIEWAYQTLNGLPELSVPDPEIVGHGQPEIISF